MRFLNQFIKWVSFLFFSLLVSCGPPLNTPNPISTIVASPTNTLTSSVTSTATSQAIIPTITPASSFQVLATFQVTKCYCGSVRGVNLTIKPIGAVGPYEFSVEPYIQQRSTFYESQTFPAPPGSKLTIHLYSSDSLEAVIDVNVPNTCSADCGGGTEGTGGTGEGGGSDSNGGSPPPIEPEQPVVICIEPNEHSNKCH